MKTNDNYKVEVSDKEVIYVPSFDGGKYYCQETTTSNGAATGKYWYKVKENCEKQVNKLNQQP